MQYLCVFIIKTCKTCKICPQVVPLVRDAVNEFCVSADDEVRASVHLLRVWGPGAVEAPC